MGQEVKNPLRAQSKYRLMGSSTKTGKKFFRGSPEHFLDKNAIWDRTPPPTHQLQSTCMGEGSRVPNLQTEFNYLDLFKSYGIFSDFVVPMWSPSSLHRPRRPHIVPVIPTSTPHHPHHPHCPRRPQKVPMWSPWSVVSTCHPRCPHIVPVIPPSSPCHPRHPRCPQKVPMWSPWSVVSTCCLHCPHVVPVIPTSSTSSPRHPCRPHIIKKVPTSSPTPPDTHSTHPHPPGWWGPWISKNAIRFELIKIF